MLSLVVTKNSTFVDTTGVNKQERGIWTKFSKLSLNKISCTNCTYYIWYCTIFVFDCNFCRNAICKNRPCTKAKIANYPGGAKHLLLPRSVYSEEKEITKNVVTLGLKYYFGPVSIFSECEAKTSTMSQFRKISFPAMSKKTTRKKRFIFFFLLQHNKIF